MFDFGIGSFELIMLAVVAIIVVGPKDLPKLLRTIGQFTTKIRGMAREFQGYLDEAARDTGLDDVKNEVSKMTNFDVNDLTNTSDDVNSAIAETAPKPDVAPSKEGDRAGQAAADTVAAEEIKARRKPTKDAAKKRAKKTAKA